MQAEPDWQPGGGESARQVAERLARSLLAIAARHPGERVIVVSHGGALTLGLGLLLDESPGAWRRVMSNCAVSDLRFDPAPSLARLERRRPSRRARVICCPRGTGAWESWTPHQEIPMTRPRALDGALLLLAAACLLFGGGFGCEFDADGVSFRAAEFDDERYFGITGKKEPGAGSLRFPYKLDPPFYGKVNIGVFNPAVLTPDRETRSATGSSSVKTWARATGSRLATS